MHDTSKIFYFYSLMSDRLTELNLDCKQLTKKLNERGYDCNVRQIFRYKNGEYVPKLGLSEAICKVLDIKISKKDLSDLLSASKEYSKTIRAEKKVNESLKASVIKANINTSNIDFSGLNLSPLERNQIIDTRVFSITGLTTQEGLNQYLERLIELDIKNGLIEKYSERNVEHGRE